MPYVQFESVSDFIPEPGARSLQWGYKREGERWGVQEVRSDSSLRGREWQELRYVLSVRACACGLNLVVLLLCASELIDLFRWKRAHHPL